MGLGMDPKDKPEDQRLEDAEIKGIFAGLGAGDMPILSAARAMAGYARAVAACQPDRRGRVARPVRPGRGAVGLAAGAGAESPELPAMAAGQRGGAHDPRR